MLERPQHEGFKLFWAIQVHAFAGSRHAEAGQQARQAKDMISMHVSDEDASQLGDAEFATQKLVLGGLTTVKEPKVSTLR